MLICSVADTTCETADIPASEQRMSATAADSPQRPHDTPPESGGTSATAADVPPLSAGLPSGSD